MTKYRPSGSVGATTYLLALGSAIAAFFASFIYDKLIDWIPFLQLDFIVCFAFAAGIAGLAVWTVKRGHCRSIIAGTIFGLGIAAAGLVGSYFWQYDQVVRRIQSEHNELTYAQVAEHYPFQRWLDGRVTNGWTLSDEKSPVHGGAVIAVWALEGLVLLGAGVFAGFAASSRAYCERCQTWAVNRSVSLLGHGKQTAQPLIEAGDLNGLISLPPIPKAAQPKHAATRKDPILALKLEGDLCPRCRESGWLSVAEMRTVIAKKANTSAHALLKSATLDPAQTAKLIERLPPLPAGGV